MTMDDEVEEAKLAQALAEVPKGSVSLLAGVHHVRWIDRARRLADVGAQPITRRSGRSRAVLIRAEEG